MSVPSERKFSPSALNFVIPARAGSKGIKNKNLRRIRGKTLVEHAVRAAVDSNYAGEIVVTSNSQDVRRIFLSTDVHFHERSSWASSDQSRAEDVIRELLDSYSFRLTDVIVYLQPTSPLRTGPHVKGALDAFFRESAPIVGVSPVNIHPSKMVTINSDGRIEGLTGDFKPSANRQSLSPIFAPNGSI
jgi:CMP-N-acetylneuraminic acid synthetase